MDLVERPFNKPKDSSSNVQVDWEGHYSLYKSKKDFPDKIRMVQIWDESEQVYIELLTNNFLGQHRPLKSFINAGGVSNRSAKRSKHT
jgi:hypothetical protein